MDKRSENWNKISGIVDKWAENCPLRKDEYKDYLKFDTGLLSGTLEYSTWREEGSDCGIIESEFVNLERIIVNVNPGFVLAAITGPDGFLTEDLIDFFSSRDVIKEEDVVAFCDEWIDDFVKENKNSKVCSGGYKFLLEEELSQLKYEMRESIIDNDGEIMDESDVDSITDHFEEDIYALRSSSDSLSS